MNWVIPIRRLTLGLTVRMMKALRELGFGWLLSSLEKDYFKTNILFEWTKRP